MALLSFDEEMERASPRWAFSNGTESGTWISIWCEECSNEPTCPLLLVMLNEKTPAAWQDVSPDSLNRYHCHEFEQNEVTPCTGVSESSVAPIVLRAATPSGEGGPTTSSSS